MLTAEVQGTSKFIYDKKLRYPSVFFPILPTLWAEMPFTPTRWHCLFPGPFLYALKKMHLYLPGQHLGNSKPELLPYVVPLFTLVYQERF